MAERTALVACHPDDEILWFSSIIESVDKVIIALLDAPQIPHLLPGRLKMKALYPLKNLVWLDISGSEAGGKADWAHPKASEFGIELPLHPQPEKYARSFGEIKARLAVELQGVSKVFTHNPWGEYGHEEHIQVYRAVESLQAELGFEIWFSNYCSNNSLPMMLSYVSGCQSKYERRPTQPQLSAKIMRLFQENNCWTWYDDWVPFQDECFMNRADLPPDPSLGHGYLFPLNMIKQTR
jgi:hypothetical protein